MHAKVLWGLVGGGPGGGPLAGLKPDALYDPVGLACCGFPAIVPASALGLGAPPPGDRITMGANGVGARGTSVLRDFLKPADTHFVAKCDVNADTFWRAIRLANERYGKGCRGYTDFQELLERPDIDAVLIAPPHHWHVPVGVSAAKAGKDMYMEKPMALAMT